MNISIVIPVFNEEESIKLLYDEIILALKSYRGTFEIIFVDDASEDLSVKEIELLKKIDSRVHLYRHLLNQQKSAALLTGIHHSQFEYVITLDGDLQNDPSDIPKVLNLMDSQVDLICGVREVRNDSCSKRVSSIIGNFLLKLIFNHSGQDIGCGLKLFRKSCIEELTFKGDAHRYLPILFHIHGHQVLNVLVSHRPRIFGKSKYGLSRAYFMVRDIFKILIYRKNFLKHTS